MRTFDPLVILQRLTPSFEAILRWEWPLSSISITFYRLEMSSNSDVVNISFMNLFIVRGSSIVQNILTSLSVAFISPPLRKKRNRSHIPLQALAYDGTWESRIIRGVRPAL